MKELCQLYKMREIRELNNTADTILQLILLLHYIGALIWCRWLFWCSGWCASDVEAV